MKMVALLPLTFAAATALGSVTGVSNYAANIVPNQPRGYENRDAVGVFGARMAVFSPAGGAFFDDATGAAGPNLHNFGQNESMGAQFEGREVRISSSQSLLPNGNQLIHFEAFMADGGPFVPVGATVAGATINALQFDIGTPNAPADPVNFNLPITIVGAQFVVTNATTTFGPFAPLTASPNGNDLTVRAGVQAGTNITTFGINRFIIDVEVQKIPAPGALGLLGLGGLIAARRRR
jgi:hypothetical protein